MDVLLGYIAPYWHEFIRSGHLGVGHRLYPESEPMSARPEARATGSFSTPHLRRTACPAAGSVRANRGHPYLRRDLPGKPQSRRPSNRIAPNQFNAQRIGWTAERIMWPHDEARN